MRKTNGHRAWSLCRAARHSAAALLIVGTTGGGVQAQRPDVTANDVWAGITGDARLTRTLNFTFTSESRRSDGLRVPRQLFLLAGLMADVGRGVRAGGGYSRWYTSPNADFGPQRPTDEHRLWQQLTGGHSVLGARVNHRLRYEQRWIAPRARSGDAPDWSYTSRARHQVRVVAPLDGRPADATRFYAMPNVELFVRTTKHEGVFFDQSRIGAGLGLGVAPRLNIEAGYIRQGVVHQGGSLEVHHVLQMTGRVLAGRRPDR